MKQAYLRFYAELNDLLPPERQYVASAHRFTGIPSVKDMVESLGVPHTEIDLILVNGQPVDFGYRVQDGDRISVYPVFEAFDIAPVQRLRPRPLRVVRFVLDTHLGRLAAHLRMLGFDTRYSNDTEDAELARISLDEKRVLLTRDRGLLKRRIVTHGYCVRDTNPRRQLSEVVEHFDLYRSARPFERCVRCNGLLAPVAKAQVADRIPPLTSQHIDEFHACQACGQVYWEGSHYQRMQRLVEYVLSQQPGETDTL